MLMRWDRFFYSALALRWDQRNAHFLVAVLFSAQNHLFHNLCCSIASLAPIVLKTPCFHHFVFIFFCEDSSGDCDSLSLCIEEESIWIYCSIGIIGSSKIN